MFSPWSIQEQIIDYKICSFITRFYYQYTSSSQSDALSVGVASQSLGSLSWLLGLTKAFFSNPCSYPSCVNVPWNCLRTLLARTSQGSPQKSWKTLSVNKSKWCCRSEPHLMRLMRRRCAQGGWTRLRRCEKTLWGRGPSGAATDCWWRKNLWKKTHLIVCGQSASRSARVQRKRRDVSCLTTFLGNGCPSWFVKKDTFELTSGEQWPQRGYVHLRLFGAATDVFFNLGVGPAPGCCCCHPQGPHAWCNASPFPNLGAPPRKQWDREFYRLATVLPVCPVSDLDGIMYIFSEVLIETWQKLAETISSKFHKIPLRKNGCK